MSVHGAIRGRGDGGRLGGTRSSRIAFFLIPVVFLLAACAGEGAPGFAVRDSAGLTIAESEGPAWGEGEGWWIDPEPLLRVGVMEGDPAYEFGWTAGGSRLDDGTLVVADALSQEVRFFDASGAHVATVGRSGEGPGEFTGLASVGLAPGGPLWAYDFSLRRITWMDGAGKIVRLTSLGPEPPVLNAVGALPDGTFVLKQLWGAGAVAEASTTGLRRDPVAYVRFDTMGALIDTIGTFPGREVFLTEEGGRGVMSTPLLARNSVGAIWGADLVVGSMERFELEVVTASGDPLRMIRIPGLDLSVTPGEVRALIDARVEAAPEEDRQALRASLETMPMPSTRPAHGDLLPDALGNLWVADWAPSGSIPARWTVLDSNGRWLGAVEMPRRFFPWQIGPDWILGVETDELEVETVVVYGLGKR